MLYRDVFAITANGLVLAAWRHRSRKAIQQNKNSWNDRLSQTTSSHEAKTVLQAAIYLKVNAFYFETIFVFGKGMLPTYICQK